jgi:hypothetical protein
MPRSFMIGETTTSHEGNGIMRTIEVMKQFDGNICHPKYLFYYDFSIGDIDDKK